MFLSFVALFALGLVHNIRYIVFISNTKDVQLQFGNLKVCT